MSECGGKFNLTIKGLGVATQPMRRGVKRGESLPHFCLVKVTEEMSVHLQAIHKMFWLVPSTDIANKKMGPAAAM